MVLCGMKPVMAWGIAAIVGPLLSAPMRSSAARAALDLRRAKALMANALNAPPKPAPPSP